MPDARKTDQTLTVRIESTDRFHEKVLSDLQAIEQGDTPEGDEFVVSLPDEAALSRVFSETNMELLHVIAEEEPESMRELARLVERDIKDVSRNLHELERLGVVRLEDAGRSKRPVVWYDEIEVRVQLQRSVDEDKSSAVA
jgi:predicted transcriptional regulator